MYRATAIVLFSLLLVPAGNVAVAGTAAGTPIELAARATFHDAVDQLKTADPASYIIMVARVAGVRIDTTPFSNEASPGQTVWAPIRVVDSGNGIDSYIVAATSTSGSSVAIVCDDDADGIHDSSENSVIDTTGMLLPDGFCSCFARITLPAQATGSDKIFIDAMSLTDISTQAMVEINVSVLDVPVVYITTPTSDPEFARNTSVLKLGGTASDNTGVASMTWFNATTGRDGDCVIAGANWTADGVELAPGANEIFITALDSQGHTGYATASITYTEALPGDAWRGLTMVSIPLIPDTTDPMEIARFEYSYWLCYLPQTSSYARYPDRLAMLDPAANTPGRGFWAYFADEDFQPSGIIPRQDQPVSIHLTPGWNLVGQPFITAVSWDLDRILVRVDGVGTKTLGGSSGAVSNIAWGWGHDAQNLKNGSYYMICDPSIIPGSVTQLDPWKAYWVYAYQQCDLILPPPE